MVFVDDAVSYANKLCLETEQNARIQQEHDYCIGNCTPVEQVSENSYTIEQDYAYSFSTRNMSSIQQEDVFQFTKNNSNVSRVIVDEPVTDDGGDDFAELYQMFHNPLKSYYSEEAHTADTGVGAGVFYTTEKGPIIVRQVEAYAHRGSQLRHLSGVIAQL
jgi:hypothetical protein